MRTACSPGSNTGRDGPVASCPARHSESRRLGMFPKPADEMKINLVFARDLRSCSLVFVPATFVAAR